MPAEPLSPVVQAALDQSTVFSWTIGVLSLLLLLGGIPLFFLVRGRRAVLLFLVLSVLPVVVGLCGTVIGFRSAFAAVADAGGAAKASDVIHAQQLATSNTLMGCLCTGLLWVIGLVVLAFKRPEPRAGRGGLAGQ